MFSHGSDIEEEDGPQPPEPHLPAFVWFMISVRDEMEDALRRDGLNDDQIVEVVGSAYKFRWDQMDEFATGIYRDMAEQDLIRYQNELAAYQQLVGDDE